MNKYSDIFGKQITITVDRPLGSAHPDYPEHYYPVNYGFVEEIVGGDGDEQDVYLLGVETPVASYQAVVIAVIHRLNDVEDKWVAAPPDMPFSIEDIRRSTYFQERFYQSEIFLKS
ncbi:MAG TPA: inorganic diphosphatase [Feifaniaceae bacterium]|nr:inorganic diphosphatase [Feifaniaceae bacterium]